MADIRDELSDDPHERTYDVLPHDRGTYFVTSASGSTYLFELGRRTVTRIPGRRSSPGIHDGVRILRSVESCEVGADGYWTMIAFDPLTDYLLQTTSTIVSIVDAAPSATAAASVAHGGQR
jgi:hypothetical protein